MIQPPSAIAKALEAGHTPTARCEVWQGNRRASKKRLQVASGSVEVTNAQFQRRSGSIRLQETQEVRQLLATPGACLRVWRGVEGVPGWIPVLWGPVKAPTREWGSSAIDLTVEDLSRRVLRDVLVAPKASLPGATVAQQILTLWRESIPWAGWLDLTGDRTAVPKVTWEGDRSTAITDLAASIGAETWMRPDGVVVLAPTPTLDSPIDLKVSAKKNLAAASMSWDWDAVVNHCVVRSDSADNPVSGEFIDYNSPTGVTACGWNRITISTATVTTSQQCRIAAESYVLRSQGARVTTDITSAVHPGVEPGDVHRVAYPNNLSRYVVDSVSFDLFGASMEVNGRIPSSADDLEGEL